MSTWIHLIVLILLLLGAITGYWLFFPAGIACELALWLYLWLLE